MSSINTHAARQVLISHKMHPRIRIHYGRIRDIIADAVVNDSGADMLGGDVYNHAGDKLREWINKHVPTEETGDRLEVGDVIVTPGFDLGCNIIHTYAPSIIDEPSKEDSFILAQCYENVVEAASIARSRHIAIPCLSTDRNFPMLDAAQIALISLARALELYENIGVTVVISDKTEQEIWRKITV